ncbi:Tyrosinase [Dactylellina cionopaga]|nr:Tyrosinase [Dactylellina cionopaga]
MASAVTSILGKATPPQLRVRRSLQELQNDYDNGIKEPLEKLIRAFQGIQALPPSDQNSFFVIAGYHGEPFRGPGAGGTTLSWWGGFCQHGSVLFPTWHRAYVLRLENALRSISGCEDVVMPFWDECLVVESEQKGDVSSSIPVIPSVLTQVTFPLDNKDIPNPLYSYTLAKAIVDKAGDGDYGKSQGYTTVRYPLSGLSGPQDIIQTQDHNNNYKDPVKNTEILNGNVKAWLEGTYKITPDPTDPNKVTTSYPDTYSVLSRFKRCLDAPSYNIFSNVNSQAYWIDQVGQDGNKDYYDSLESPHNAIHLSVGGFYSAGNYDADAILGANGDMGENDTAAFDPIFFFHHCFIDHVFWLWQVKNGHEKDFKLVEDFNDPGLISNGVAGVAQGDVLTLETRLWPFQYNSCEVIDIEALGYTYGPSSLTPYSIPEGGNGGLQAPEINRHLYGMLKVGGLTRDTISGSFVVETWAVKGTGLGTKNILLHSEPVLSRWGIQGCVNCQNHLELKVFAPVHKGALGENPEEWTFRSVVRNRTTANVARPTLALHPRGSKNILKITH